RRIFISGVWPRMSIDFLLAAFDRYGERPAIVWHDRPYSYAWLAAETGRMLGVLAAREDIAPGSVIALSADYSPASLALLLALLERRTIAAPLTRAFDAQKEEFHRIAEVATEIIVAADDQIAFAHAGHRLQNPLLVELAKEGAGGLILFSSGATGKSK